jgi:hypothetical protein
MILIAWDDVSVKTREPLPEHVLLLSDLQYQSVTLWPVILNTDLTDIQRRTHNQNADNIMFVQTALDSFLFPEASSLAAELDRSTSPGFRRLNAAVAQLVDEWSMVSFAALDYSDEESIGDVLAQIDHCIQVGAPHTLTIVCGNKN